MCTRTQVCYRGLQHFSRKWMLRPSVIALPVCCGLDGYPRTKHRSCRALWMAYRTAGMTLYIVHSAVKAATHVRLIACSVGVFVQEFDTVITTDSLLTPGFFDLSLCPTRSSMAGCVVSQAKTFHDNVSVHRFGLLHTFLLIITSTIWLVSCCFSILFLFSLVTWLAAEMAVQ